MSGKIAEPLVEHSIESLRGLVRGAEQLERGLVRRLLRFVVEHRELWNHAWQEDLHIVGDTNLGEIRFDVEQHETIQRLWWWFPESATHPSPATEYRAPLTLPAPGEAPPLPPPMPAPPSSTATKKQAPAPYDGA